MRDLKLFVKWIALSVPERILQFYNGCEARCLVDAVARVSVTYMLKAAGLNSQLPNNCLRGSAKWTPDGYMAYSYSWMIE